MIVDAPTLTPTAPIVGGPATSPPVYPGKYYPAQAAQDMTVVGRQLWVFDKSDTAHPVAKGWVRDPSSFALVGEFTHNMSHAATVTYQRDSDTLMIGNAGDRDSNGPRIDLLPRFSSYRPGAFLDWHNASTTPRVSITLARFGPGGSQLRSIFADRSMVTNAVWIDKQSILAFTATPSGLRAVTVRLGMGAEDLSAAGYGDFLPGRAASEYNGTAAATASFTSDLKGITQGAEWRNGKLYLGWSSANAAERALQVLELSLTSEGKIVTTADWRWLPTATSGKVVTIETEGVTFQGSTLLVTGRREADNFEAIYSFFNVR